MDFGQTEPGAGTRRASARAGGESVVTERDEPSGSEQTERRRIEQAQRGDQDAFAELSRPLQRELHLHCYRMLGSLDDADDALQETLFRAWRGIDRFEPRSPVRAWFYRIATNVSLSMLTRRVHRAEIPTADLLGERDPGGHEREEPVHLDPYPDRLLDLHAPVDAEPEATAIRREGIELAFVSAVQLLPPRQRAAIVLHDVVGYPAAEIAAMLDSTVAGVNSALQRARASLEAERRFGVVARPHTGRGGPEEQSLVRRLVDAWHAVDIPAIAALLTEDALLTMPPQPERYVGRDEIAAFISTVPAGGRLDRFRFVPVRVNRQPALAAYLRRAESGPYRADAVIVLAIDDGAIASLTRFGDARLFDRLGLPPAIDDELQPVSLAEIEPN
jgi:RNA polymerase sigma-70 factor (ECF subfamily)